MSLLYGVESNVLKGAQRFLLFIVALTALKHAYLAGKSIFKRSIPSAILTQLRNSTDDATPSKDPCNGRSHCVIVYVTPAEVAAFRKCLFSEPLEDHLNAVRAHWKTMDRPGLKVIVGNDSAENLEAAAKQIGGPVFLDMHGHFGAWMKRPSYNYFVLDSKMRILESGRSAMNWVDNEIRENMSRISSAPSVPDSVSIAANTQAQPPAPEQTKNPPTKTVRIWLP